MLKSNLTVRKSKAVRDIQSWPGAVHSHVALAFREGICGYKDMPVEALEVLI